MVTMVAIVRVTTGSSQLRELTGATSGTDVVYCTLHGDTRVDDRAEAGMDATLVVP